MDKTIAEYLLKSFLERADGNSEKVFISSIEIEAVRFLFGNPDTTRQVESGTEVSSSSPADVIFNLHPVDVVDDFILCLDFGTSFSKAFANKFENNSDTVIDLEIGSSETGGSSLFLPSELFIDEAKIYFGVSARLRFNEIEARQERLIDSPKQYLTLEKDVTKLGELDLPLADKRDPERRLKQRDALTLFLAHLNLRAEKALKESGNSPNILRRYTHPAWGKEISEGNKEAMRRILAEAIAISRTFPALVNSHAELNEIVPILTKARTLTDAELESSYQLIGDAVREATAAGGGVLKEVEPGNRQSFVIVDIGAGTSDVAGCYCVHHGLTGDLKISEETSAAQAIRQAGNNLDDGLLSLALSKVHHDPTSAEHDKILASIRKMKRQYKEVLFTTGQVLIPLPDDSAITITLAEFVQQRLVKNFVREIKTLVAVAAEKVFNKKTVYLIPTGGGARLPFIKQIVDEINDENNEISLEIKEAMPEDLKQTNPDLIEPYPQLAVAVGGSMADLPEQKSDIRGGISDPGKRVMEGSYKS